MRFSKAVVKYRVAILIVALALLAPAVLGMVNTRINYDMLDYLPEDMDTVIGQNELLSDFGKGAFSLLVVEDMEPKDVAALKGKILLILPDQDFFSGQMQQDLIRLMHQPKIAYVSGGHLSTVQPAGDSFEMISGTTGLLGCADGSLLMQKKKRTALEATIDVVGRDQQDQILYLKKDADTQIWNLEKVENELHKEPPDHVLDAVAGLLSAEHPIWTGSPSALADAVHVGMAANVLSKYLNVKSGRLLDEYHVHYENKVRHEGRRITLTYDAESK